MFIDFHTHIFPDKVAAKAIPKLAGIIQLTPSMDGTYHGLKQSMEDAQIDISVVLPTVTATPQYDAILSFAAKINETFYQHPAQGILSLASVHPLDENCLKQLTQIKSMGFQGVKIHPNYQDTFFNDIRYKRILAKASELDLFIITHTGNDPYTPETVYCSIPMILEVLGDVRPTKLVLAHMGSNQFYDDIENYLLGCDAYLDTAYTIADLNPERLLSMIRKHGADKVLFGSDAPWTTQKKDVDTLSHMGLTKDELDLVSHKNALKLLNL